MTNIFEGQPDGRQSDDQEMKTSRFRPRYRALTVEEKDLHDAIKEQAAQLEELYEQVKNGRYRALALTSLEESVMWVIKELTS